jgi:Flp pilus assembly protein TadG
VDIVKFNRINMNIKKIKKHFSEQCGQVAIIVGLSLVALVGILAYVIDTGSLYQQRRDLQSIADSSALAGVQELPENPGTAVQKAIDYAGKNNFTLSSSDVVISSTYVSNDTITVKAKKIGTPLFFAGIFGQNTADVGASATAVVGSPAQISGAVPWAVLDDTYVPGVEYNLKYGDPSLGPGNFGAVSIDGRGASTYRYCIEHGSSTPLHIGSVIETETGNMTGPTAQGTTARVYDYENYTFDTFAQLTTNVNGVYKLARNDSQYIIIPIVDHFPNGRKDITITGFLKFIITYLNGSTVKGTLISTALVETDSDIGGVDSTGFRTVRLTK